MGHDRGKTWVNLVATVELSERVVRLCVEAGLTAGERYNISLFAVTSSGVSNASSALVYSKEKSKINNIVVLNKGVKLLQI